LSAAADRSTELPAVEPPTLVSHAPPVAAGPPRRPKLLTPGGPRLAGEIAVVLRFRLLAAGAIGLAAVGLISVLNLYDPRGRIDWLSETLYLLFTLLYAGLLLQLYRRPDYALGQLRRLELIGFGAYVAHYAWKDYQHYVRYWPDLHPHHHWLLQSH